MTWAETIEYIRQLPEYTDLVKYAYFEKNLHLNVERFIESEEFLETNKILKTNIANAKSILDVGCGAGFTSVAFALNGFEVTALEPDPDDSVGFGAIKKLADYYKVKIKIAPDYFEKNRLSSESFDIVYARQSMHHAGNLEEYLAEAYRLLKEGGVLLTVRDHVVSNSQEKEEFLKSHPLQKFYGGENAYSENEYTSAMRKAGFKIEKIWSYYESVLNFFPMTKKQIQKLRFRDKVFFFRSNSLDELKIPGRIYSFLASK